MRPAQAKARSPDGATAQSGINRARRRWTGEAAVARMERSDIRGRLSLISYPADVGPRSPDVAEFIIGPAEGRTRWLHPGYGRSLALKKAATAELNSRWKAARSNPGGSRQASGAAFANAGVHGARNAKWPAFGTTWYSGFVG